LGLRITLCLIKSFACSPSLIPIRYIANLSVALAIFGGFSEGLFRKSEVVRDSVRIETVEKP
jgi:hypothetical protein